MSTPAAPAPSLDKEIEPAVAAFYRQVLHALNDAGIPFLVGGAFAHACHTGIRRSTKDLDLFIRRQDFERIAALAKSRGWQAELAYPHWLAKVYGADGEFIDLIFNSGNGLTPVDDGWFDDHYRTEVLGVDVGIANVEDVLMSKAFLMERERYDGGDVAHLLQTNAEALEWPRMVERFGTHWRVLLAHLTLFGYIYPDERHRIPTWVMALLLERLEDEMRRPPAPSGAGPVCAGTLLSREQYLHDVERLGYSDARLTEASTMTQGDVEAWTRAIPSKQGEPGPGGH